MNSTTYDEFVTDLLLILLTSIFFLVIKFKLERQRISKKDNNHHPLPPGPKPWPIIGCLPQMLKNKPVFKWIHSIMKEMDVEIACIRLGNTHVIPVTCPKIACEFLKTNDAIMASRPYSFSTELVSMGYLSTVLVPFGEQWKKMRKLLVKHLISSEKHKWQHDKRIEEADHLVRYVFKQCMEKGGLVNVRLASQHYAGNVTRKLVFNKRYFGEGGKDGGPGLEEEEHVDAVFTILEYIFAFCVSDYLPCLKGLDLDGHEKVVNRAIEIIRKFHDPIIEERIQSWNDGTKTQIEDMLDAMITAKDDHGNPLLCLEEIKAQTSELMIEIMDNPPNIAEWTLAEMLNQPQILEKAVEELDRVVGKERLVQESDFSQLNYIKACLRESMRLHPLYPFDVPHVSTANTVVSNYFIPKGSHVLLSRLGLGRNPKIWNEPLEFRPERHLKNDGSEVVLTENELRFISFGTGRRGCPGVNLGTSMAVMLLARLVHGFTWSVPSRIHLIEAEDKLVLAKPLHAKAKPRLAPHLYPA